MTPRPVVALGVAGVGTIWGIGFFIVLRRRFVDPAGYRESEFVVARQARAANHDSGSTDPQGWPTSATALGPEVATDEPDPIRATNGPGAHWGGAHETGVKFQDPPAPGVVRRLVSSRLVPLRAAPGELGGVVAGRLDVGDEVEVVRHEGPYSLVRTPSGAEGWVLALAITSLVPAGAPSAAPTAIDPPSDDERPATTKASEGRRWRSGRRRS